jgi:hypothetical protein
LEKLKAWELSMEIFLGNPNLANIFSSRNSMIFVSVVALVGMASTYLVK